MMKKTEMPMTDDEIWARDGQHIKAEMRRQGESGAVCPVVTIDDDFMKITVPLDEYIAMPVSTYESQGTLEAIEEHLACVAGRLGRLVQILYGCGALDVDDIRAIVGRSDVPGGEFRGEITSIEYVEKEE